MKYLFLCALLISCASTKTPNDFDTMDTPTFEQPPKKPHKYKVGDCLMIVDLPSGQTHSRHRVKIVSIDNEYYYYKWLLDNGKWALGPSKAVGRFETLEKISKKVKDCPKD